MKNHSLDEDEQFFADHADRLCHIRPVRKREQNSEFMTLGPHDRERRAILVWKVPKGHPFGAGRIIRIPFLKFADETIEDDDRVLMPLLDQIMKNAAKEYGMAGGLIRGH